MTNRRLPANNRSDASVRAVPARGAVGGRKPRQGRPRVCLERRVRATLSDFERPVLRSPLGPKRGTARAGGRGLLYCPSADEARIRVLRLFGGRLLVVCVRVRRLDALAGP